MATNFSYQSPNYELLMWKKVTYQSNSGKIKEGILSKLIRKQSPNELIARIEKWRVGIFKGHEYVPVTHILGKSFDQLNLRQDVIVTRPSAPPARTLQSSQSMFRTGGIDFYGRDYGEFKIGNDVVWMLETRVEVPLVGKIQMIGSDASAIQWGIVQFDEGTSHLPNSVRETPKNRNMIKLDHLLNLDEWLAINDVSAEPENSSIHSSALVEDIFTNNIDVFENDMDAVVDPTPVLQANVEPSTTSVMPIDHSIRVDTNVLLPRNLEPKKLRGIQGSNNSCYIDASIFALFVFNTSFDASFSDATFTKNDYVYNRALVADIVRKLREVQFVSAEEIMKLRKIFAEKYDSSFLNTYKDAEEFIELLFVILGIPHLLQYTSGGGGYIHKIFLPSSWTPKDRKSFVMVQSLLGNSFKEHGVELQTKPLSTFILKLPVSNGILIPSNGVVPNLTIDISNIISGEQHSSVRMHLSAVICLRNNCFAAFTRASTSEKNSPWIFMDSRPCDSSPDMVIIRDIEDIILKAEAELSENPLKDVDDLELPNGFRLFRDAYLCIYLNLQE